MIHLARPTVSLVVNLSLDICFVLKSGEGRTDGRGRTNGQHVQKQWSLPAEWINLQSLIYKSFIENFLSFHK